ncbi:MAG: undecaprenyldiphospho-muramoylpentapeptide beta-N-acetylglucosaminyltransferase, partial [Deltaproteobacteria bacterium RIFOXYD12_FULL_50_9]
MTRKDKILGLRVVLTGGGTGGHLFPGIAVAEALLTSFPSGKVMFIGTGRHIDNKTLAQRGFQVEAISCQGLKGKSIKAAIASLWQLPWSLWQAIRLLREFKPVLVIGVGGYVTGPVMLAARLLGKLTCIHEQNSIPGLANRLIGGFVHRIFISLPGSERYFPAHKTIFTGNPVRRELVALGARESLDAGMTLVVLGGSQGAHRINQLVTGALSAVKDSLPASFQVIHQTGADDESWVRERYERMGICAEVAAFFNDMPRIYQEADLIVSRAGATTLAEIAVVGVAALLIPYPFAADDHQKMNAL